MIETVTIDELATGMWVAALDRPWRETPVKEAFMIEREEDIARLREHCRCVIVDWSKSRPDCARKSASTPAPVPPRRDERFERTGNWRALLKPLERLVGQQEGSRMAPPSVPLLAGPLMDTGSFRAFRVNNGRQDLERTRADLVNILLSAYRGEGLETDRMREAAALVLESIGTYPYALRWLSHMRDDHLPTYEHALACATFLIAFARQLKQSPAEVLELGLTGILFDLGKLKLDRALLEHEGPLAPEQTAEMERHVDFTLAMLSEADDPVPALVARAIEQHHERMDGRGYPHRLPPSRITVPGHMAAIVDGFVAMTRQRPYGLPLSPLVALSEMQVVQAGGFMPALIEQFRRAIGLFPIGSLVELSTGEVAIVALHNEMNRGKPEVLIVTGPDKQKTQFPYQLNLAADPKAGGRVVCIVRALPKGAYGVSAEEYYGTG
jgi:HD-GYP domain-containing protein (c-di-GMP phosphodiesterase class II)